MCNKTNSYMSLTSATKPEMGDNFTASSINRVSVIARPLHLVHPHDILTPFSGRLKTKRHKQCIFFLLPPYIYCIIPYVDANKVGLPPRIGGATFWVLDNGLAMHMCECVQTRIISDDCILMIRDFNCTVDVRY